MHKQEEVTIKNKAITLAGTLTIPEKSGRHPAVILLPGSGPVNRDVEIYGWKTFRMISNYFIENGIAVLRYDARGVGGSTGDFIQSTFIDFAEDCLAAVHYLKKHKDINTAQIGLYGHSQGGIVAPIVASQSDDVAFIICIAGIGITGEECFITQNELIAKADGATDKHLEKLTKIQKQLFDSIRKKVSENKIKPLLRKIVQIQMEIQGKVVDTEKGKINEALENNMSCLVTLYQSPWGRFFLDYDPKQTLEKVKCPVLLIFGGLDLQVESEMNKRAMVDALKQGGNNDYTVKIFPKANHLFQSAKTGHPSKYPELCKEFVPDFLEFISDWILRRVNEVK